MWLTWDHQQCYLPQCLQWSSLDIHIQTQIQTSYQHPNKKQTHSTSPTTQIQWCNCSEWLETIANGLCSDVFNFAVCKLVYTINRRTHITSQITLTTQIQCCKWLQWLETISNALCSIVSNRITLTSTNKLMRANTQMQILDSLCQQKDNTSLTMQIQYCKWCEWLETITNA